MREVGLLASFQSPTTYTTIAIIIEKGDVCDA